MKILSKSNFEFLSNFPFKKSITILPVACLLLIVSVTMIMLNKKQNIRSNASYFTKCNETTSLLLEAPQTQSISSSRSKLKTTTESVKNVIKDYRKARQNPEKFQNDIMERKKELIHTMRNEPKQALEHILSSSEQIDATLLSNNCVEKTETIEGNLEIIQADFPNEQSQTYYILSTNNNEKISLHQTDIKTSLFKSSSLRLRVSGYKLDHDMLIDNQNSESIQILPQENQSNSGLIPKANASSSDTVGEQKTAVILIKTQSSSDPAYTSEDIQNMIFGEVNSYYKENSYNKTFLTGNTFGWYTIPDLPTSQSCDIYKVRDLALDAANKDIDYTQYERIIIGVISNTCAVGNRGTLGRASVPTPDGQTTLSTTWVQLPTLSQGKQQSTSQLFSHELGHNFGILHASYSQCQEGPFPGSGCSRAEYGDKFSVMGSHYGHLNAPHKDYLGWFNSQSIQTVTTDGVFKLEPFETSTLGLKSIKIPRGANDELYLEYRQPIGFDSSLKDDVFDVDRVTRQLIHSNVFDGVLIHTLYTPLETLLNDATPPTSWSQVALLPGESIYDPISTATIKVTDKTSSTISVDVKFGQPQNPPSISPTVTNTPTITEPISPTPSKYSVSGYVFLDNNSNGVKDTNEQGYQGVTIFARQNGKLISRATSNKDGLYYFSLSDSQYVITGFPPSVYSMTSKPSLSITVKANMSNINFGIKPRSIVGYVFIDQDKDGVLDSGEQGYQGATINIFRKNSTTTFYKSAITRAYGSFSVPVPAGTYYVSVVTPSGYHATGSTVIQRRVDTTSRFYFGITR